MAGKNASWISRRNERIIFQKNTVTIDKYKNHLQEWTDYFSCFTYASTFTAEEDGDEVINEEKSITFETRWCPELADVISTEYRILFKGASYNIVSVDMMNYQRQSIRFTCRKEKR